MRLRDAYIGQKVEGGRPYSEDYDEGEIVALYKGGTAEVAWSGGIRTGADVRSLRDGWSDRFPEED